MKPRNFPARKLARQLTAKGETAEQAVLLAARAVRTKITRKARKS
jgi:hypothetical protein